MLDLTQLTAAMRDDPHRCRWNDEDGAAFIVEIERLRAALTVCAKLNCAKGPVGKHYKDPVYCGTCSSCQAREALR